MMMTKHLQSLADQYCSASAHCTCLHQAPAEASNWAVDIGKHRCHCGPLNEAVCHQIDGRTQWLDQLRMTTVNQQDPADELPRPTEAETATATSITR